MWPLVITFLYLSIILWVIGHAFNLDVSLTKLFVPFFIIVSFINIIKSLYKRNLTIISNKYLYIIIFLLFTSTFSSIINYFRFYKDLDIIIYSFLIPFILLLSQLIIWILPTSKKQINKILYTLKIFFIINGIITAAFFIAINIFKIIDLDMVWDLSIQNTVLMKVAGQTWYRTPGIFEIGGTNGTFLLMFLSISLSKFYYSTKFSLYSKYLLYISIISILIFFTLTRRTYLCLFVSIFIFATLKSFKNPTISKLLFFVLLLCSMTLSLFIINLKFSGLFSLDSFYDRLQFWYMSLNNIIGNDIGNLLIGLNILQSALKHSIMSLYSYSILDNGFIECIMHSGIIFLLLFLIYICFLFKDNLELLNNFKDNRYKWIPMTNIFLLINMVILMLFSSFLFNLTESFIYLFLVSYFTKFSIENITDEIK